MDSTLYTLVVVIGPIVLLAAIAWAIFNNRRSREDEARTEAATRQRYAEQDADDKANAG
jgi:uncharacterized membrane protein